MGYRVICVQRRFFDFKAKPPSTEIVTFVRVSADLIRQKLPFNEIMQLLVNDIQNRTSPRGHQGHQHRAEAGEGQREGLRQA